MNVVALAGGVGAGKFLRGVVRAVPPASVTAIVNTGDDIRLHGLHVSPDLDSVTYWLAGVSDRDRGWGLSGDTFGATEELRKLGSGDAWFNLGDLDLATHLYRTECLEAGLTLSEATTRIAARFGLAARVTPMSNDRVATRLTVIDGLGEERDLHFQEYWVQRHGEDEIKSIRYEGAEDARPAPGVLQAIRAADVVLLCPSNPIASITPILAVPGIRSAVAARREQVVGISGIVGGAPLAGMADKLLPVAGVEVSAAAVAEYYRDLLGAWVVDSLDASQAGRIESMGIRVAVTDTIMATDGRAEALARVALNLV